jgi:hypothetical protein
MTDSAGFSNASGPPYREKRDVPRFSLIATAELTEPASGVRFSGRISEISRKGCFLDLLNTLPVETKVELRVSRDKGSFNSTAKVIYVQEGMGMGLAFLEVPADQLKILDSWLAELNV